MITKIGIQIIITSVFLLIGLCCLILRNKTNPLAIKIRKALMFFGALLGITLISGVLYVEAGKYIVKNKMFNYLKHASYTEADIHSINVYHSFTNISSYNEWDIEVVYMDEPSYEYFYALKNGEIVMTGSMGPTKAKKHEYVANNLIKEISISDCYNEIKYVNAEERELILDNF